MVDFDYIVVGVGLSGIACMERLEEKGFSFVAFDDASEKSTAVAGGLYNPVILKRFTLAWNANRQLEIATSFYKNLEKKLDNHFLFPQTIYRKFTSEKEHNDWFCATDNPLLSPFLDTKFKKQITAIKSEYSFGKVNHTGVIDTGILQEEYKRYLINKNCFKEERFSYQELFVQNGYVKYKTIKARNIIFCEGFGMRNNPYFKQLPMNGNKGEYLIIHAPKLKLEAIVKSSVFIIPLGEDRYKVGATYNRDDKTLQSTILAKEKLVTKLEKLIDCSYKIIGQEVGIRPTTIDRRPLVGHHPAYANVYVCNGFGSRGVLIAPSVSKNLIEHIVAGVSLPKEIDIKRFL